MGLAAEGMDDAEVLGGGGLEETFQGFIAMVADGLEELGCGDVVGGAAELVDIRGANLQRLRQ